MRRGKEYVTHSERSEREHARCESYTSILVHTNTSGRGESPPSLLPPPTVTHSLAELLRLPLTSLLLPWGEPRAPCRTLPFSITYWAID